MSLNLRGTFFLNFALFLFYQSPSEAFELVEKEDIYKDMPCPAFLVFDSVAYLTDMTFELPCRCKPEHINSVVWYYKKRLASQFTRVLTDFKGSKVVDSEDVRSGSDLLVRFSIRMFSLIVFQAQTQDSGHYICGTNDRQYFYGYYVDMQQSKGAYLAFGDKDEHPQKDLNMNKFTAFTTFWDWTPCDRCSVRGEQRRLGLCYIRSEYLHPRYRISDDNVASCGSGAVPSRFKVYVAHRRPEIVVRSCEAPCYVRKKGLVGGIQHLVHMASKLKYYLPWVSKAPIQVHTHTLGANLAIACPGAKPHHAVAWDKDEERMYLTQFLVGVNESMRVFIDHGNHLNIHYVRRGDKATYYCWVQGRLKAGFRLEVRRDPKQYRKLGDQESIFAMRIIGITIICCTVIFVLGNCLKCFIHNFKCFPF